MSCDIIIPVWNRRELTQSCVESIMANTSYPYRIIAVDNASDDLTRDFLDKFKEKYPEKMIIIRNSENLGNTIAVNQGIKESRADYVCILDNDTEVAWGWLSEMVKIAESEPDIGLVNPASNSLGTKKSKDKSVKDIGLELRNKFCGQYVEIGAAVGFCTLIKREVIEKVGGWDEVFSPGYFDDTEHALRAARAGYRSVCAQAAFVYHREHASFRNKNLEAIFIRNREIFHKMCGKPKRVLYIINKFIKPDYKTVESEALKSARQYNWVWIFLNKSLPALDLPRHGNIKQFLFKPGFFVLISVFKVLTRQKKKFDLVYVQDSKIIFLLRILKFIHRAEIKKLS